MQGMCLKICDIELLNDNLYYWQLWMFVGGFWQTVSSAWILYAVMCVNHVMLCWAMRQGEPGPGSKPNHSVWGPQKSEQTSWEGRCEEVVDWDHLPPF